MPIQFNQTERRCKNILLFIWSSGECTGRHQTLNLDLCIAFRLISTQILSGIWPMLGLGSILALPSPKTWFESYMFDVYSKSLPTCNGWVWSRVFAEEAGLRLLSSQDLQLQSLNSDWRSGPTLRSDHGHYITQPHPKFSLLPQMAQNRHLVP